MRFTSLFSAAAVAALAVAPSALAHKEGKTEISTAVEEGLWQIKVSCGAASRAKALCRSIASDSMWHRADARLVTAQASVNGLQAAFGLFVSNGS